MLEHLRDLECRLFDGLGIPYRVVDTATGDLGGPAYRKFDLEAWMPGRGEFGEVTSTSNCTDYQARRLNIRYKVKGEKGTRFVHTLNGTAIAISRALIAILENYQQADGSVVVPEVLRPWVGKERIERAVVEARTRDSACLSHPLRPSSALAPPASHSRRASAAVGASAIARTIGSVLLPRTRSQRSGQSRRRPSSRSAVASRKCVCQGVQGRRQPSRAASEIFVFTIS